MGIAFSDAALYPQPAGEIVRATRKPRILALGVVPLKGAGHESASPWPRIAALKQYRPNDLAREGAWERSLYRLRAAHCLFDERVEAPLAEVANRYHVGIGVAGQKFHDVGTRFRASCVQLERDEVRKRHDS